MRLIFVFLCALLAYSSAVHPQAPLSQQDKDRLSNSASALFTLDPTLGIRVMQGVFGSLRTHCAVDYPDMREALDAAWASWPYSTVKVEILVNGRPYNNDRGLRFLVDQALDWTGKTVDQKKEACMQFGSLLAAVSTVFASEQVEEMLPRQARPPAGAR